MESRVGCLLVICSSSEDGIRTHAGVKADFQSIEFSERAEMLLFAWTNFALKLNRQLRLSNFLLPKIPLARKIPADWNLALRFEIVPLNHSATPLVKISWQ